MGNLRRQRQRNIQLGTWLQIFVENKVDAPGGNVASFAFLRIRDAFRRDANNYGQTQIIASSGATFRHYPHPPRVRSRYSPGRAPSPILTVPTENCNTRMTTPDKILSRQFHTCGATAFVPRPPLTHSSRYPLRVAPTAAGSSAALTAERLDRGVSKLNCRIL